MKPSQISAELLKGSRLSLARAITYSESARPDHRELAEQILNDVFAKTGRSVRIGISGPPGVGKSSFIDELGAMALARNHRVAVLTIDPSSPLHGGSILGDKTRMVKIATHENAFVRPSPSSGHLGGLRSRTREAILLCEAAGFDFVIVETVGVGQSDHNIDSVTDFFLLLHLPQSGDDLQGIKRGAIELADLVLVTKADGDLKAYADIAKAMLEQSLHLSIDGRVTQEVILVSSRTGLGISEVYESIEGKFKEAQDNGSFKEKRNLQESHWFKEEVQLALTENLERNRHYQEELAISLNAVIEKQTLPSTAARSLVNRTIRN